MNQNWFNPINLTSILDQYQLASYQLGNQIKSYDTSFPELAPIKVAMIGIDSSFDSVRKHLYKMSFNFGRLQIADFGNLKAQETNVLNLVLKEILSEGIIPIIIGQSVSTTYNLFKAYQSFRHLVNLAIVDEKINLTLDRRKKKRYYLDKILNDPNNLLFNLGIIGYQSHYVNSKVLNYFDKQNFEYARLGNAKRYLDKMEPIIRDVDCITFAISALKKTEAPGCINSSPSGFWSEEMSQLAYYAGLNDKLSSIGFLGFEPNLDRDEQTAQVIAQMIWYFLSGFSERKQDYPISLGSFTEYIVDFKNSDYQITFWKSNRSDRWWMQVPTTNKEQERHRLIPCSYHDYQMACKEELPERLINAYNRFS